MLRYTTYLGRNNWQALKLCLARCRHSTRQSIYLPFPINWSLQYFKRNYLTFLYASSLHAASFDFSRPRILLSVLKMFDGSQDT